MGALVQIPGGQGRQGILIDGAGGNSSSRNYLVICDAPDDLTSVGMAFFGKSGIEKTFAKRISKLPSGLSLYGFSTKSTVTCSPADEPVAGESYHAIRLEGEGTVPREETVAMTAELNNIRNQINDNQRQRSRQMMERSRPGRDPRDHGQAPPEDAGDPAASIKDLTVRQSELAARLKLPMSSIKVTEVAAGHGRDLPESSGDGLENTLLASSTGKLRAIRFNGKWIDLKDVLASAGDQIGSVKLNLSGSQQSVNLSCDLAASFPSAASSYSMVAVTTFELESQGSGSLEERLASATPVPFQGNGGTLSASRQLEWNGRKTKLWLKVFNNKEPGKPLLDEVILLDYPGAFSARWGKPPSPLITLPAAAPDTPEDLVKERQSIDAKGEIRDLVAAGDGSVLMVQTDKSPYWAPLDLKSGRWLDAPWKATADTLVATQSGKIYLIDRRTKVVEIWGLESGKREALRLLPLQGTVSAVAAPLSDATQPVMVSTDKDCYLLDPVKFEVIPSGLELGYLFDAEVAKRQGQGQPQLDPSTLVIRAADDGSLYSLSGIPGSNKSMRFDLLLTVDRSGMVVYRSNENQLLGSRGRNTSRGFPDHGGSGISITPSRSSGRFPGPAGEIRLGDSKDPGGVAVLKNPPVLPERSDKSSGHLAADRGVYLDSSIGAMLLPDGDQLHFLRLNLPQREKPFPEFLFAGETLEIPLPKGTGHQLVSQDGGTSETGPTSIRWTPAVSDRSGQVTLKLTWTGELGSEITKDYRIRVIQSTRRPEVLAADGTKAVPLHLRRILNEVDSDIVGFAGSGNVVLVNESGALSAWNLATGEMVLRLKQNFNRFFGDADRIYVLADDGKLTSYDILTGQPVGSADLGQKIRSITTGSSSRAALLAVEQEGTEGFLIQIPRDTLKANIMDLSQESRRHLFIPELAANASGSAVWSREVAIFRDQRAITMKPFSYEILVGLRNGVPDASGQFIVGGEGIFNMGSTPPKGVKISSLPGMEKANNCKLDESGRYVLIAGADEDPKNRIISVRDVRDVSKPLLKIRFPSLGASEMPWLISGTNTFVQFQNICGSTMATVYDFDISQLTKELSH